MSGRPAVRRRSARTPPRRCPPGRRDRDRRHARRDRTRAGEGTSLDAGRSAARQHLDGRLRRAQRGLRVGRGPAARRAADPRRRRRQAARAGHRRADLHRRADPAGRGRGGAAGADRRRRRSRDRQACAASPASGSGARARTSAPAPRFSRPACGCAPQEIGLAASVGIVRLPVYRKVRAALFSTGNELVMPGEPLPPGAIYNSSRFTLTGLFRMLGCEIEDLGIVPDTLAATREALRRAAATSDIIVTSGGVSVGDEDHVRPAVDRRRKTWICGGSRSSRAGRSRSARCGAPTVAKQASSACPATRCRAS